MKKLKLFPKTFLYTIGIMSVIVLLVHGLMYVLLPSFYLDQKREEVSVKANELMDTLKETSEEQAIKIAEKYAIQHNVNIILGINDKIYRYQGFTPIDIYYNPADVKDSASMLPVDENQTIQIGSPGSLSSYKVILEKITFENKDHLPYELHLMLSIQPVDETKQVAFKLLPYSIAISFIISLIAAYIYSKVITRPIQNILRVTKEMETLKKDSYCIVDSEDEIGMLAENINALYDTLWHTIESLEQKINDISEVEKEKVEFLRAASHELKTPLTSLHILLENMKYNIGKYGDRDFYLGKAAEMVMESTEMVQNILNTSKLQTVSHEEQKEKLDVREVLLETIESYKILAKAKEIQLTLQVEETCFFYMNKEALRKVLSNLLSNAINYTGVGKKVEIQMVGGCISIENECTPLSGEVLAHIFKAFYRPDFSRNKKDGGTGLGLYIVKNILTHANLRHSFTPSDLGMKFIIECPPVDEQ
ncbi:HAMP domain-containing sensor histidine kinase [Paenibacillus sp. LHD-38]|uniref:sensor histidine kinase n=1 Tax=Paenibacillus sp. LHD-38 TaxID=3072143 RepID=UPI00280D9EE8|nr:HAMP domain-containing sensor histidine kinase [Paenibacillus sp. LHD-38]MDQ8735192.1 HAMP domain-containing sensor histidine kinase [Paenibacillus sp. LHD-38]